MSWPQSQSPRFWGSTRSGLLDNADVLAISGGVPTDIPIVKEAIARGIPVTNDSLEFA